MSCPTGHVPDWRGWTAVDTNTVLTKEDEMLSTRTMVLYEGVELLSTRSRTWLKGLSSVHQETLLTEEDYLATRKLPWLKRMCWCTTGHCPKWRGWVAVHQVTVLTEEDEIWPLGKSSYWRGYAGNKKTVLSVDYVFWPTCHFPDWRGRDVIDQIKVLAKEVCFYPPGTSPYWTECIDVQQVTALTKLDEFLANKSPAWLKRMSCSPPEHCPDSRGLVVVYQALSWRKRLSWCPTEQCPDWRGWVSVHQDTFLTEEN
jgi:hypothetical protein